MVGSGDHGQVPPDPTPLDQPLPGPPGRGLLLAGAVAVFATLGAAGCGGGTPEAGEAPAATTTETTSEATSETTTVTVPVTTSVTTTAASATQPTTQSTMASTSEDGQSMDERRPVGCQRLTDFEDDEANRRWLVVNDDVMGGRSDGGLSFESGALVFEGDINTNGGGFSSLRLPLDPGVLVGHDRIELRARPDGRTYMVTFDDDLPSRDRRVSHRSPIPFDGTGEWQTVSVAFEDLFPAIFGRPIEDLPFREDLASRLGLMISDGLDGPFRLEVDWIDLCGDEGG